MPTLCDAWLGSYLFRPFFPKTLMLIQVLCAFSERQETYQVFPLIVYVHWKFHFSSGYFRNYYCRPQWPICIWLIQSARTYNQHKSQHILKLPHKIWKYYLEVLHQGKFLLYFIYLTCSSKEMLLFWFLFC